MADDHRARAAELFAQSTTQLNRRTDLLFGVLFGLQFVGAIVAALFLTPRTWAGAQSAVHVHVWAGLGLGGLLCLFPMAFIVFLRGHTVTRYVVACAQMMFSALLIHLCGGRIEAHFHVFGSLAFLAFYRDWRLLLPATAIVAIDHLARGMFWPQSVFGVLAASPWRALEHAGWVVFEDVFLIASCVQARREMRDTARVRAELESSNERVEQAIADRTSELETRTHELQQSEERFRLAVSGSQHGVWDWDLVSNTVFYAPRWKELLGCAPDQVSNAPDEWFRRIASGQLSEFFEMLSDLRAGHETVLDTELEMTHADGSTRWMLCRAASHRDAQGHVVRLTGSLSDISELKAAQERLRQIANHDRLTGLPNREVFTDRIALGLAAAKKDASHGFAVLFGDFDGFKTINDSLGHSVGDAMLVRAADVFRENLRDCDTVARFGGDEFAVLVDHVDSLEQVELAANRLIDAFSEAYMLRGHEVVTTLSLGIVMSSDAYETPDEMLRDADAAMYQAKTSGKSRWQRFDETMHEASLQRLNIGHELRRATASMARMDEALTLHYQPIVNLSNGEIAGFEALVRWNHGERGCVRPAEFIGIAEETGLIMDIGEWTVRRACEWMAAWRRSGGADRPMVVHVNLSRRQLAHTGLVPMLRRVLEDTGVRPKDLKLEITESTAMDDRADVIAVLGQIRELGIGLAIDDFGTGHSSLSCIRQFPIQTLKIDRAFLVNMTNHREHSALIHAIVELADNLNLDVVAEGIEDAAQLSQLQAMDCGYGQGFYFSPAVTPFEALSLLAHGLPRAAQQRRAA